MQAALHFRHAAGLCPSRKHTLKFTKYTRLWMALPEALCYNLRRDTLRNCMKGASLLLHTVHLSAHGYEADILPERGANLAALTRPALGLSSVRTPASLESFTTENPYLWGIPILLPPNRISGAQFTFEGRTYRFPMNEPAIGNFIHGMLHETPVLCVEQAADHAVFLFRATAEQPYMTFPHAFTLRIAFALEEDGLHQRITVTNDSTQNMPFALGFHTTFALPFVQGGRVEDVRLKLGVAEEIVRNMDTFLPTGEVIAASPLRQALLQGTLQPCMHTISRHFAMDASREMRLTDAVRGVQLIYRAQPPYAYWMLYNGGRKDLLCVEPQTWVNNCPNAPFDREKTGFRFLTPGESRTYETQLTLTTC